MLKQKFMGLGTLLLLGVTQPVLAQQTSPPQIEQVNVGLPAGSGAKESGRVRPGAWTPVYIKIKAGKSGNVRDEYRVLIQATDAEGALYTYPVPLPALEANRDHIAVGYVRPSNHPSEIKVVLQNSKDGQMGQPFPKTISDSGRETVVPSALLVVSVGSRLNNLKDSLNHLPIPGPPIFPPGIPNQPFNPGLPGQPAFDDRDDEGARRFAFIESVDRLPDQWYGYEAADVVVLTTGQASFVKDLLEDSTHRREALLEWVRRGGLLVLSVESTQAEVARLLEKMPLLEGCKLDGSAALRQQGNLQRWIKADNTLGKLGKCAVVKPGPQTHTIVADGDRPVIVQGSCGLGRVMLVAFDLDVGPFTEWSEADRRKFWTTLLGELVQRPVDKFNASPNQARHELLSRLQGGLETFDVPVIHFGWVTLFILLYILVVGPLDYFVLKKVFKRLELTWITFPSLVILISILAYVIAYRSKGDGLRINKIDLVEYDLAGSQAYGHSWFSVFSPRIQKYTVGQEPVQPAWASAPPTDRPNTMLTTVSIPTDFQRVGSRGLFPQPYAYADNAEGVQDLPIPVWATRTFTTSWHAPVDPDTPPIAASLSRSRLESHLPTGKIKNNLPVALDKMTLFYNGHWYSFDSRIQDKDKTPRDTLAPGQEISIDHLFEADGRKRERLEWLDSTDVLLPNLIFPKGSPADESSNRAIKAVLFHPDSQDRIAESDNSGLRLLNQTWRVKAQPSLDAGQQKYRSEIILVARTALVTGPIESFSASSSAPTRLWLGELPGQGRRPVLPGQPTMTQETYIRVYIPLK